MFEGMSFLQYVLEFVVLVWFLAAIANKEERKKLKESLGSVVSAPSILPRGDQASEQKNAFPRGFLEEAAAKWEARVITPLISGIASWGKNLASLLKTIVPEKTSPWKILNYLLAFVFFMGFLLADAILINNTLQSFNLAEEMGEIFNKYGIAITFGSLISVVIGGIVANDIYGEGDFTDWGMKKNSGWIWFGRIASIFLIISGLFVITALGLARYGRFVDIPENIIKIFEDIGQFVIHVLTPLNAGVAAALIAEDGFIKGLRIIVVLTGNLIYMIGLIIAYMVVFLVSTVIFIVDVLWRFLFAIGSIVFFLALTPLDDAIALAKSKGKLGQTPN